MITCEDATRLISEGQDRNLTPWERIGLRLHLWMCDGCRLFEKQIGYLREIVRRGGPHDELPGDKQLPPDARERIRETLKQHSGNSDG